MPNTNARLLSPTELLDVYSVPILSDIEHQELFTFNEAETKILKGFKDLKDAVYFSICLVFFKTKQTLIDFNRSEEHTSELQSLMRISYAVFCLKKKKYNT